MKLVFGFRSEDIVFPEKSMSSVGYGTNIEMRWDDVEKSVTECVGIDVTGLIIVLND